MEHGCCEQNVPELNLTNLSKELELLTRPVEFGIALGIPQHVLETIEADKPHDVKGQKIALFKYIATNCHSENLKIMWNSIADALKEFHGNLSKHIRTKFGLEINDPPVDIMSQATGIEAVGAASSGSISIERVFDVSGASLGLLSIDSTSMSRNLKDEIDELEKQFEGLKNATLFSLVKKGEKEEDLFIKFRLGLASLSGSIQKRHVRFFTSDNRAKISRSQSFEEIFAMLGDYWTFLNCSLLLHININFTDGDVNELMQSFESRLSVFCHETTVAELSGVWRGIATPDSIEILAKSHHHNWESLTLHEVNSISECLAHKASLQSFAFPFKSASPGSVVLTWALPRHLAPLFAHFLDSAFLDTQGIDALRIGGVALQEFRNKYPVSEVLTRKFLSACQSGEVEVVVDICLQHLQLEKESAEMEFNHTALHFATKSCNANTVKVVVDAGADLEAKDVFFGKTALHIAVEEGETDVVKVLVNAGANLEARDWDGRTALLIAARNGKGEIVKVLVDVGASLEAKQMLGDTALYIAAEKGYPDVAKILVEAGANVEEKNKSGKTALLVAAGNGRSDVVKILIDGGANLEAKNNSGRTALLVAAAYGRSDVVNILVEAGASLEAKNNYGRTALLLAASYGECDIVDVLIEARAILDAKDNVGNTILMQAAKSGAGDLVKFMLKSGAQVDEKNKCGLTALDFATEYGIAKADSGVIQSLKEAGAKHSDVKEWPFPEYHTRLSCRHHSPLSAEELSSKPLSSSREKTLSKQPSRSYTIISKDEPSSMMTEISKPGISSIKLNVENADGALQPVSVVKPIIVLSQRTPAVDKEEIQYWLLTELKKYQSPNGAKILPIIPNLQKESASYECVENDLLSIEERSNEPCFLCVVNQEFKEDWDDVCSSTSTLASNKNSLIFSLSRRLLRMAQYRSRAFEHVMVLYWSRTDTFLTLRQLVPPCLRECKIACVKDTETIASFVFEQPAGIRKVV